MEILDVKGNVQCSSRHGDCVAFGVGNEVVIYHISDMVKGREVARMGFETDGVTVAISPCGTHVVAGLHGGLIEMRSLVDAGFRRFFQGHGSTVGMVFFSLCGFFLISGSDDETVKIWDSAAGVCLATVDCGDWVRGLTFLPGGQEVLGGTWHGMLIVIGMDGVKRREVQIEEGTVTALACAGDAVVVAVGDGRLQLREAARLGNVIWSSRIHQRWINDVCVSPSGAEIATACDDNTAVVVSFATGDTLRVLEGHTDWLRVVHFSADGSKVITGSDDETVRVWGLFPKTRKRLSSVLYSIDPEKLLYHGEDLVEELYGRLKRNFFAIGVDKQ